MEPDPTGETHYTLKPSPPFELAVRIPADWKRVRAVMAAPENPDDRVLDASVEQRHGASYAVVQAPAVRIYALIALERLE